MILSHGLTLRRIVLRLSHTLETLFSYYNHVNIGVIRLISIGVERALDSAQKVRLSMTLKGAISKLERNGWAIRFVSPRNAYASKPGRREIHVWACADADLVDIISVDLYKGPEQFDASSDLRFCDTIKEAMEAA
jgi:hypothetical protein